MIIRDDMLQDGIASSHYFYEMLYNNQINGIFSDFPDRAVDCYKLHDPTLKFQMS